MSERNLRIGITILAVIASLVHFYLAISGFITNRIDALTVLWLLNALGYLGLLTSYLGYVGFLKGEELILGWSLIAYAIVTMIAWWNIDDRSGALGWFTAVDETLLVVAVFLHMRKTPPRQI